LFGRGRDGNFYAMRRDSSTVAQISPDTFAAIAARPFDWRDTVLMPFSIVDLAVMRIETPIRPPLADPALTLNYSFLDESWTARQYGEDATARLNTNAANELLTFMEGLRVEKWLSQASPAAKRALQDPSFRFTAVFREVDESGDRTGVREASFDLAPASRSGFNRYYYGRLAGDPHFFLIGLESYRELTRPLMEGD
ncbi:MAG: DUF4340 domain-containing protein, partial [Akkermansiaceae bacterium]|nr:DUF4340 domain-containing protein [Akkermansiaceae bacterium]